MKIYKVKEIYIVQKDEDSFWTQYEKFVDVAIDYESLDDETKNDILETIAKEEALDEGC